MVSFLKFVRLVPHYTKGFGNAIEGQKVEYNIARKLITAFSTREWVPILRRKPGDPDSFMRDTKLILHIDIDCPSDIRYTYYIQVFRYVYNMHAYVSNMHYLKLRFIFCSR